MAGQDVKVASSFALSPYNTRKTVARALLRDGGPDTTHVRIQNQTIITMNTLTNPVINGIDTEALRSAVETIRHDASQALTSWHAATTWKGGTRSDTRVTRARLGDQHITRDFTIRVDEPSELCGTNLHPNPQEYLLSALNACMTVGYIAGCALHGITVEELRIETEGEIDLRGFFALDDSVAPGYESLRYSVHIKGDGTPEQFEKIHQTVIATSPNYYNLARPVKLHSKLIVES